MVLPSSGQISLGQIQGEFGGGAALSQYYRGGAYTTGNNTNVPTSGPIALSHFYSAYRGYQVTMNFSRDAENQNYFYLSALGWPTIEITAPVNGSGWFISYYYIPANVTYTITANEGAIIRKPENVNGMQLEDSSDGDFNDLEWYPNIGVVYSDGINFYYKID